MQTLPSPAVNSWLVGPIDGLLDYCRKNQWAGWDPYDGLNSPMFASVRLLRNHFCRLVFIQLCKRSPINFRPLFGVPKEKNPKGLALFSSALIRLARLGMAQESEAKQLLADLLAARSPGRKYTCWGYNFDWQTRTYLVPRFSPNIICTTFAGNALLDGYDAYGDPALLEHAVSAGDFLVNSLNRTGDENAFCFSYTPLDRSQIHNANLLGAAFLARLYFHTRSKLFLREARASTRFSVPRQRTDGSWPYGEAPKQQWIDSFHTGYNLVALERIQRYTSDEEVEPAITKGFNYFRSHFFAKDGMVKYYHNRAFPIDTHAIAQAVITLVELRRYDEGNEVLARRVVEWGLLHMRHRIGCFYYQKHPLFTNKIPYMRWCQAWMLQALACIAEVPDQQPDLRMSAAPSSTGARLPPLAGASALRTLDPLGNHEGDS